MRLVTSAPSKESWPEASFPEIVLAGRSNVGKSSLINMLANNKKLAKTSATPGQTLLINHFIINNEWYLVDLPGYGYAKVSKTDAMRWLKRLEEYLITRRQLKRLFILIDSKFATRSSALASSSKLSNSS